jgi:hypothetical protein
MNLGRAEALGSLCCPKEWDRKCGEQKYDPQYSGVHAISLAAASGHRMSNSA